MNRFKSVARPLMWFMALLLVAFAVGCSKSNTSSSSSKAVTAYSVAGTIGTIDESAKTIALTVPNGTTLTALVATYTSNGASVKVGATNQTSGTTPNDFTNPVDYIVTAADGTTATYTVTVTKASASANAISVFSIGGSTGVISGTASPYAIAVTVPSGTTVTALVATFASTGASVKVGTTAQTSGTTPNDFTSPVAYIVTAADSTTATYNVTVTVASTTSKALSLFSLGGSTGVISGTVTPFAIAVTVPSGTNVTALIATFASTGVSVKVGATAQTSGATPNNFTSPVAYIVTAADSTTATYNVTVTVTAATAKAITAFSFASYTGAAGTITGTSSPYAIAVAVPSGTTVTALVATFATTGASVKVGTTVQTSGTTPNNFASPVAYTVTAGDASTAVYNVTVAVASATSVFPGVAGTSGANATNPTVIAANPSNLDTNVPTSVRGAIHTNLVAAKSVTATFNSAMDPTTINSSPAGTLLTFTLMTTIGSTNVPGTVSMNAANTIATFTPTAVSLTANTSYTATITTAAKNTGSVTAMPKAVVWSFTTRAASAANQASPFVGQAPIDLLTAGNFVILAQTAITDVPASVITGDIGLSSAAGSNIFVSCAEMAGTSKIYAVDATYAVTGFAVCTMPGPGANKTLVDVAVADKGTAFTEAAGRTIPDAIDLGAAEIGGKTFYPGLYKYTGACTITTDVTLDAQGDTNAVWIFQIAGDLTVASGGGSVPAGIKVILAGGAKASNIFWQVAASSMGATINAYDTFNGNIMSSAQVIANTGAVVNGRMFAATQVTLQQNPVTQPAP